MNLDLSEEQVALDQTVADLLGREATDATRLAALESGGFLDVVSGAGPIEGVLVVERAAEILMPPLAARVLIGPLAGVTDLPAMVGLVDARAGRVVRHAMSCEAFFVVDESGLLFVERDDVDVEPVPSFFGPDFGRVSVRHGGGRTLHDNSDARIKQGWQAALAVEASAVMLSAVAKTAEYVTQRVQFGRPLGALQAVQHRLATSYAMAMAARWLARRAVWFVDDAFLTSCAATYACHAALLTHNNTHQVTGAIGLTTEYGLVDFTHRLLAIRQELGGQRTHARRAAQARRQTPQPWPSPLPVPEKMAVSGTSSQARL
jgi:hypothetical protein